MRGASRKRRFVGAVALLGVLAVGLRPSAAGTPRMSMSAEEIQEVILRVKPATVLIAVQIQGKAAVSCVPGASQVVPVEPRVSTGTGFVIHPDRYIATNAHVVGPVREPLFEEDLADLAREAVAAVCAERLSSLSAAERAAQVDALSSRPENRRGLRVERKIEVSFQDGKTSPATVLASRPPIPERAPSGAAPGATPPGDVAILKVERRDLVAAPLGSTPVQIGDEIFVMGFPGVVLSHELLSPRSRQNPSVTLGRVSGFKLDVEEHEVIQTDAAITWGNSGGPAFDPRARSSGWPRSSRRNRGKDRTCKVSTF